MSDDNNKKKQQNQSQQKQSSNKGSVRERKTYSSESEKIGLNIQKSMTSDKPPIKPKR